jgi:hypothetical protein
MALGTGFVVLALISAASIALDVKSRSDAEWIVHTLGVLKKLSDTQLLIRRVESGARGFALTSDPHFVKEYRETLDRIAPAFSELIETTKDNPTHTRLLESSELIVARRLEVTSELIRLQAAGDSAGIAALTAKGEGELRSACGRGRKAACGSVHGIPANGTFPSYGRSARRRADPDIGGDIGAGYPAFKPKTGARVAHHGSCE